MNRRLKVIICAYACEPNKGSEPGVGWEYAKRLAKWGDVWVVTRANNREVICNELLKHPVENLHFVFLDLPKWARFWKVGERGMHLYYFLWQVLLLKKVIYLHNAHQFDIFHHLTFGNIWLPTFVPLIDIPFIWGPIGGGEKIPFNFMQNFSFPGKIQECFRIFIILTLRFNPWFIFCCRRAKAIIVKTEDTAATVPKVYKNKVVQMTDVGISRTTYLPDKSNVDNSSLRIICVGKLLYWRGFDIAIRSFARIRPSLKNAILIIVGNGAEKEKLIKIADEEGVLKQVIFMGALSEEMLQQEMNKSIIFLNPCFKEGGVTILINAMQYGLPVVSVDTGGVTNIVPGIKIPLQNPEQVISMLAEALLKLGQDSTLREQVGRAGRASVERHTWEEKARQIFKIYIESQ